MGDQVTYENGKPTYQGDEVYKCYKDDGNGLLFRIVNNEEKTWAFYNDTTEWRFTVRIAFYPGSDITPIDGTQMDYDEASGQYWCINRMVPLETKKYMTGTPNGFKIMYEAEPWPPGLK